MDIKDLVILNDDNVPTTTSRKVAEICGKRHADVIRKIESLECSISFAERNIALSDYKDSTGKKNKMYKLTRDGMSFLINKMSGEKAAEFTEKFISAFNAMEAELLKPKEPMAVLPDFTNPVEAARAWADQLEGRLVLVSKVEVDAPKVEAYDSFLNLEGTFLYTEGFKMIKRHPNAHYKDNAPTF